jgi:hypothetical protein
VIGRKKQKNPHTIEVLALARVIADSLNSSGQLNPPPGLVFELRKARSEEQQWQPEQ